MKKGFTLIELLAVIIILALLMIVAVPNVLNTLNNAKASTFVTQAQSLWSSAETQYVKDQMMGAKKSSYDSSSNKLDLSTIGENVKYCVQLNGEGKVTKLVVDDGTFKITAESTTDLKNANITDGDGSASCSESSKWGTFTYIESILNGTDPVLGSGMIPVVLTGGTDSWTVKAADTDSEWYKYQDSKWANAVILKSSDKTSYKSGDIIPHDSIEGYYVWIPKYSYQIFDLGNYTETVASVEPKNQIINIEFGTTNTTDVLSGSKLSCVTPGVSGESGNCQVGSWMTHPAFLAFGGTGFWVGKFETTGTINSMSVLPLEETIDYGTVGSMFKNAKNYKIDLASHMMKNTEWGAVAYLTNSSYGRGNTAVYNNNYYSAGYKTGCVGNSVGADRTSTCQNEWYTTNGIKGSTTGNITGIYDMSGGVTEYMAAYTPYKGYAFKKSQLIEEDVSGANSKYVDTYDSTNIGVKKFNYRILGDATGELGPFLQLQASEVSSSWYGAATQYLYSSGGFWFYRGVGIGYNMFSASSYTGGGSIGTGFRVVLSPSN